MKEDQFPLASSTRPILASATIPVDVPMPDQAAKTAIDSAPEPVQTPLTPTHSTLQAGVGDEHNPPGGLPNETKQVVSFKLPRGVVEDLARTVLGTHHTVHSYGISVLTSHHELLAAYRDVERLKARQAAQLNEANTQLDQYRQRAEAAEHQAALWQARCEEGPPAAGTDETTAEQHELDEQRQVIAQLQERLQHQQHTITSLNLEKAQSAQIIQGQQRDIDELQAAGARQQEGLGRKYQAEQQAAVAEAVKATETFYNDLLDKLCSYAAQYQGGLRPYTKRHFERLLANLIETYLKA